MNEGQLCLNGYKSLDHSFGHTQKKNKKDKKNRILLFFECVTSLSLCKNCSDEGFSDDSSIMDGFISYSFVKYDEGV
jgi:hypothetical protein